MKNELKEYERIRVRRLNRPPDYYDDWRLNQRPPQPGDVGVLIDILQAPGVPDGYVVESSGSDGITVWLCTFASEEIEPAIEKK